MNNLPPDQSQPFVFNASIDYLGQLPANVTLQLVLEDANNVTVLSVPLEAVYQNNETITGNVVIDSSKVGLWWPAGHGPQNLYHATITIKDGAKDTIATVERRVGFRTIVLNLSPISDVQTAQGIAPGANWHFEINGIELYAKGSNLVPPDVFWPRVNETKMRQ
jgi:beta-mannosidase